MLRLQSLLPPLQEEVSASQLPASPPFLSFTLLLFFAPAGDQYALKIRFVDHVFDEQVVDSLTLKIILPEGAK